jgi:hypothetical protein
LLPISLAHYRRKTAAEMIERTDGENDVGSEISRTWTV